MNGFQQVDWSRPLNRNLIPGLHSAFVGGAIGYNSRFAYNLLGGWNHPGPDEKTDMRLFIREDLGSVVSSILWGTDRFGAHISINSAGRDAQDIFVGEGVLHGTETFTIACTLAWTGTSSTNEDDIFGAWVAGNLGVICRFDSDNNEIDFSVYKNGGFDGGAFSSSSLSDGEPHHLVFRLNSDDAIELFVDGVKHATSYTANSGGSIGQGSSTIDYGWGVASQANINNDCGRYKFYDGFVWRNRALSDSEVRALRQESLLRFPNLLRQRRLPAAMVPATTNDLYIGSNEVTAAYLGATSITKIYKGSTQIFGS